MNVRFLLVFDLLFILFRIALWPSVWKKICPSLFTCVVFIFSAVIVVRVPFPFGVWGRVWILIVLVPDHCPLFLTVNMTELYTQPQNGTTIWNSSKWVWFEFSRPNQHYNIHVESVMPNLLTLFLGRLRPPTRLTSIKCTWAATWHNQQNECGPSEDSD